MTPQVVRRQFGPAPVPPVYTPTTFEGFEPIIIDLSKRRRKRWLMSHMRAGGMIGACALAAVSVAVSFMLNHSEVMPVKQARDPYFIPAAPEATRVTAPAPVAQEAPHLTLPPIPQEVLSPEVEALIPVLKKLPIAEDFVPKNKIGKLGILARAAERTSTPRLSISVIHDSALEQHDKFIAEAAEAVKTGKNEAAIKLYSAALKAVPNDRDAAYNLVSLLLQKAAFFDSRGNTADAVALYERILKIWGEKDDVAQSVRQRLDWIKQKPGPLLAPGPITETSEVSE